MQQTEREEVQLTCSQVCKVLGTSYWRVHNAHRRRAVPEPRWVGKLRVYRKADIERLAKVLGVPAPSEDAYAQV
jgi:hypothetical protein